MEVEHDENWPTIVEAVHTALKKSTPVEGVATLLEAAIHLFRHYSGPIISKKKFLQAAENLWDNMAKTGQRPDA